MAGSYKIPVNIIKLDESSFHLIVKAKINGFPVNVLIDTGASRTVFDTSLLGKKLELSEQPEPVEMISAGIFAGDIESQFAVAESFKLGRLRLNNFRVVLINLEGINKLYMKITGKQVHGLLGSDFLLEMNAVVDYEKAMLFLKNP